MFPKVNITNVVLILIKVVYMAQKQSKDLYLYLLYLLLCFMIIILKQTFEKITITIKNIKTTIYFIYNN